MNPKVTVLMPVYNAEKFLNESIESILNQTFKDFEFLIINDGSTDNSLKIIKSYKDKRIKIIENSKNKGIVYSLNKGIKLAKGEYIARMDADDVSLPRRIEKQVKYLDENKNISVISSRITLIYPSGREKGFWEDDFRVIDKNKIYNYLPINNCIAHPTVMLRKEIFSKYQYKNRRHTEDYDLWLRLSLDKYKIGKLDEVLVKYRMHHNSITFKTNLKIYGLKNLKVKFFILIEYLFKLKINKYYFKILLFFIIDIFLFIKNNFIKRRFIIIFEKPLVLIGKLFGYFFKNNYKSNIFFFFPSYHIGGADKVHVDIVDCIKEKKPEIIITNKSLNTKYKDKFSEFGNLWDIYRIIRNPFLYLVMIGYFSVIINSKINPIVFGCNTFFYYRLLPYLKNNITKIDLIHAFGSGIEDFAIKYDKLLNKRITINKKTLLDLYEQYNFYNIKNIGKIVLIENKILIPKKNPDKNYKLNKINLLYVGRGSKEKRIHLIGMIAHKLYYENIDYSLTLIGDNYDYVNEEDKKFCNFTGPINDDKILFYYYKKAYIHFITSEREGFPMTIMEGMSYGVVCISTDVGGISYHIKNNENGFLVNEDSEKKIVDKFVYIIKKINKNRLLLEKISKNCYNYARIHFNPKKFNHEYKKLFNLQ